MSESDTSNDNWVHPDRVRQIWAYFAPGSQQDQNIVIQIARMFHLTDGQMEYVLANPPSPSRR